MMTPFAKAFEVSTNPGQSHYSCPWQNRPQHLPGRIGQDAALAAVAFDQRLGKGFGLGEADMRRQRRHFGVGFNLQLYRTVARQSLLPGAAEAFRIVDIDALEADEQGRSSGSEALPSSDLVTPAPRRSATAITSSWPRACRRQSAWRPSDRRSGCWPLLSGPCHMEPLSAGGSLYRRRRRHACAGILVGHVLQIVGEDQGCDLAVGLADRTRSIRCRTWPGTMAVCTNCRVAGVDANLVHRVDADLQALPTERLSVVGEAVEGVVVVTLSVSAKSHHPATQPTPKGRTNSRRLCVYVHRPGGNYASHGHRDRRDSVDDHSNGGHTSNETAA